MEIGKTDTRRSFIVFGLLLGFFIFFRIAEAETEIIRDFSATITIREDGSVFVSENIIYDFGPNQKHGIFRDIPLTATAGPRLDIEVLVVSDEEGQPYPYTTAVANDVLRIKIGDPNIFISGVKTYNISYLVHGAIRTFSDHDELYWNVTGNQWPVPIQGASAMVTLPADFAVMDIKMDCFTGPQGSTQKDCVFDRRGTSVSYSTNQPLKPNEGLTFVLGMPPGYITKNAKNYVSPRPAYSTTLLSLLPLLLSIIVFVGVIILRSRNIQHRPELV